MLDLSEKEISKEENRFFEFAICALITDEVKKKQMMSMTDKQKYIMIEGYRELKRTRSSSQITTDKRKSLGGDKKGKDTTKDRKSIGESLSALIGETGLMRSKSISRIKSTDSLVQDQLEGNDLIIFKMIVDDECSGKDSVFNMYMNLSLEQKHVILEQFHENQKNLIIDYDSLPFTILDREGFIVNFWSVLSNLQMKYAFWLHLQKEINTDSFEFVLEIMRMRDQIGEDTIKSFDHLLETYVYNGSPKELNIGGDCKRRLIEMLGQRKSGGAWEFDESPRIYLETLRMNILLDLKMDSFERFISSETGFDLLALLHLDSNVISKDPLLAIKNKLERSMLQLSLTDVQMTELAGYVATQDNILEFYLNTDMKSVMQHDKSLKVMFDQKDRQNPLIYSILTHKKPYSTTLPIKLAWIPVNPLGSSMSRIATLLSPIMDIGNKEVGEYQMCIIFGNWLFSFDDTELCIPKVLGSMNDYFSVDIDNIHVLDGEITPILMKIASFVTKWNATKAFIPRGTKGKNHYDNVDFIEDFLKMLESTKKIDTGYILEIANIFKNPSSRNLKFSLSPDFQFQINFKSDMVDIKDHVALDEFSRFVLCSQPELNIYFPREYWILKAHDYMYWRKWHYCTHEIERIERTITSNDHALSGVSKKDNPDLFNMITKENTKMLKELREAKALLPSCQHKNCPFTSHSFSIFKALQIGQ